RRVLSYQRAMRFPFRLLCTTPTGGLAVLRCRDFVGHFAARTGPADARAKKKAPSLGRLRYLEFNRIIAGSGLFLQSLHDHILDYVQRGVHKLLVELAADRDSEA